MPYDKEIGLNISPALLQRKFKLSFAMAKEICDLASRPANQIEWVNVELTHPPFNELLLVYGKPINMISFPFEKAIAHFDIRCGWIKHDKEGTMLYVTHWQTLTKDP